VLLLVKQLPISVRVVELGKHSGPALHRKCPQCGRLVRRHVAAAAGHVARRVGRQVGRGRKAVSVAGHHRAATTGPPDVGKVVAAEDGRVQGEAVPRGRDV
jgi:hypothetical protein